MDDTLNSLAGRAINQLSNFNSVLSDKARILRESSIIKCQRPTNYSNCSTFCLFDVFNDPCETQDLSSLLPEVCIEYQKKKLYFENNNFFFF